MSEVPYPTGYNKIPPYLASHSVTYHKSYSKGLYEQVFAEKFSMKPNYKAIKMFEPQELIQHLHKNLPLVRKTVQQFDNQMQQLSVTFGNLIAKGFHIDDFLKKFFLVIDKRVRQFFEHVDDKAFTNPQLEESDIPIDYQIENLRMHMRQKLIDLSDDIIEQFVKRSTPIQYDQEIFRQIEAILRIYDLLKYDQGWNFIIQITKFNLGLLLQKVCDNQLNSIESCRDLIEFMFLISMKKIKEQTQTILDGKTPLFMMNKELVVEKLHSILKDRQQPHMAISDLLHICKTITMKDRRIIYNEFYTSINKELKALAPEYYQYVTTEQNQYQQEREKLHKDLLKVQEEWETLKLDENYYIVMQEIINEDDLIKVPLESEAQLHQLQRLNSFSIQASNLQQKAMRLFYDILDHKKNSKDNVQQKLQEAMQKVIQNYDNLAPGRTPYSGQIQQYIDQLFTELSNLLKQDLKQYHTQQAEIEQRIQQHNQSRKNNPNPYLLSVQKEFMRNQMTQQQLQAQVESELKKKSDYVSAQMDSLLNQHAHIKLNAEDQSTRPYSQITDSKVQHGSSADYHQYYHPVEKKYARPEMGEPGKYEKEINSQPKQNISRDPYIHGNKGYYADQILGQQKTREQFTAELQAKPQPTGSYERPKKPDAPKQEPKHPQKKPDPKQEHKKSEPSKQEPKRPEPPKQEPKKHEPPKQEHKRPEPPKQEPKKPEPPKQEPKKHEPPKQEHKRPEPPKQEPKKPEPPKQEPKKHEPPKQEPKKPEPPKQEPKKPEPPKQEPKKPEAPKQEPKKPEPPKQEPKKPEPPKQEPKKPEPPKQEPKKPEPPKQEPKKPEPPKQEPKKPEPPKQEPKKPEPPKQEPKKPEPPREEPKRPEPPREEPKRPEPHREEPKRPDPPREEPKKPQPPREEPKRPEPPREEPKRPEPPREEPKRPEPHREEPKRPEPRREEPKRPEPHREEPKRPDPPREEPKRPEPPKEQPFKQQPPRMDFDYGLELDDEDEDEDQNFDINMGMGMGGPGIGMGMGGPGKTGQNPAHQIPQNQFDNQFDDDKAQDQEQQDLDDGEVEQGPLHTIENLQQINQYIRTTKFGKQNAVQLDQFNVVDFMISYLEELMVTDQLYVTDIEESDILLQITQKVLDGEQPDQEVQYFEQKLMMNYAERIQKNELPPRIYFPFADPALGFYLLEKDDEEKKIVLYFEEDPAEFLNSQEVQAFISLFQQIMSMEDCDVQPMILDPSSAAKINQICEDPIYLKTMLTVACFNYDPQPQELSPIFKIGQDLIERCFWHLLSINEIYEELGQDPQNMIDHFQGIIDQQDKKQIQIIAEELTSDGLKTLKQKFDQIKLQFIKEKSIQQVFYQISLELENLPIKYVCYVHLKKLGALKFMKIFFIQSFPPEITQIHEHIMGNLVSNDGEFAIKIFIDQTRHNLLYEFNQIGLGAWVHLTLKKNYQAEEALAILNMSTAPFHIIYKGLE